jgi:crotonobetainyl-CoA:carnitine CoA-transferase CaiB-like acyl-CoA transferase
VLSGLRVLDCSTEIAGAYCTKMLADAGADVIKIEPAGGDPLRSWGSGALFEFLNTSKRSAVGSLADPAVLARCEDADIVVESGPPGAAGALDLHERNPALVLVSITPYGQDGPWADWGATEFALQAWCGSIATRGVPERPPVAAGGRIGEWMAGTYAAVGAVAAQLTAARTGAGEHVDVAWLDCMSLTMNTYTSVFAEFLGWPAMRRPNRTIEIPSIEATADGYAAFTTNSAQQWADFLLLIGRPDKSDDTDLASALGRFKRRAEAHEMIDAYMSTKTTTEALEEATTLRIPSGPVGNGATVTEFDHFVERGTFVENPSGRFVQPRVPYKISELEPHPLTQAPALDTKAAVPEWAEDRAEPIVVTGAGSPDDAALPLAGIRVLDTTAWWAGPAATHMLACLGADVIKVESVSRPDLMRYTSTRRPPEDGWWEWGPLFHGANINKRGITLDLTSPRGRELFERLLPTADVLLENFSPRVMDQFGLSWRAVHAANPSIVMVRLPAYGLDGPWRDRTGFAQTMEGITGMAWITGWDDGPPVLPRGACDPLAAMHAVFATLLALRDRAVSGDGHLVEVTMIEAALNAAAEQVVEYSASGELLGRHGNRGPVAAPQNLYACAGDEEWLALAVATDAQCATLQEILGDPEWAADPSLATPAGRREAQDDVDAHLGEWCADQKASELAELFASRGVPAGYVTDARDIAWNPQLQHRGYFEVEEHAVTGAHPIPMVPFRYLHRDAAARDGARASWMRRPSPLLGEHNDEVLGDLLGLPPEELATLRERDVIGDRPAGA